SNAVTAPVALDSVSLGLLATIYIEIPSPIQRPGHKNHELHGVFRNKRLSEASCSSHRPS
ncbi:MAG: hypothetical protein ACO20W_09630, partial [Anaerohalosphaeraceae bacterium]